MSKPLKMPGDSIDEVGAAIEFTAELTGVLGRVLRGAWPAKAELPHMNAINARLQKVLNNIFT